MSLVLSGLAHTWLIDLDGTVLRHNGHKDTGDELLPGVKEFWSKIPSADFIILLSARETAYRFATLAFLRSQGLWWTDALFGLPRGERVLINDIKPGGLRTALAINVDRDLGLQIPVCFESH